MSHELVIILALILANGLLAGAEIAIVTIRKSRLRELVAQGGRSARAVERLREMPERFLATVQVGITVVGATAAAFGGSTFAVHIAPLYRRIPALADNAEELALGTVVVVVSFLSLILGELVPKSLAMQHGERYALLAAQPLSWLAVVAAPVIWFLTATSNLVLRAFGDRTNFTEARLSMEELRGLVDEAAKQGSVPAEAGDIASRALDFGELKAADVMVHRRFVVALPVDADPGEVRKALLEDGHRRLPVYGDSLDDVRGYILWSDVVQRVWDERPIELATLVREAYYVPETTPAADLLEEMQRRRNHLAIVVDEHGGLAGIVTLEDLLEELVGNIASEHDRAPEDWTQAKPDGWFHVPGAVPVREVERELHLGLPEPEEWTTIGGLAIQLAGERIPRVGEEFSLDGVELVVEDSSRRRVRFVRLRRGPESA